MKNISAALATFLLILPISSHAEPIFSYCEGVAPSRCVLSEAELLAASIEDERIQSVVLQGIAAAWANAELFIEAERSANGITVASNQAKALGAIAQARASVGEHIEATRLLAEAERSAAKVDARARAAFGPPVKDAVMREIVNVYAAIRRFSDAERLASTITTLSNRAATISDIAFVCDAAGETEEAYRLWIEAELLIGDVADVSEREVATTNLALKLTEVGRLSDAERLADVVGNRHLQAKVLGDVVRGQLHAGKPQLAEQIANRIEPLQLKSLALSAIAKAQSSAGQDAEAARLWANAEQILTGIYPEQDRDGALLDITKGLAEAGHFSQADASANRIVDERWKVQVLVAIARELEQAGHAQTALQSWYEAERISREIPFNPARVWALLQIATSLTQADNKIEASRLWAEAELLANSLESSIERDTELSKIAAAQVDARELKEAMRIAHSIDNISHRATVLTYIAEAF